MSARLLFYMLVAFNGASLLVLIALLFRVGKSRGSANVSGTGMSAKDLAGELGPSIESAFRNYIPQPDKLASAVTSAAEATMVKAMTGLEATHAKITQSYQAQTGASDAIKTSLAGAGAQLSSTLGAVTDKMQAAMAAQAQGIEKAAASLSAQADRLLAIGKDVEKLLHASEAVDGALKTLGASEEFKKTLLALQSHLAESDKLIREVSKPRTIRLVEQDGEVGVR